MIATDRASRPLPSLLFDLDGTLIDSIELILNSARYAFHKLDRTCPPDEEWMAGIGIPLFTMFRRYARDEVDTAALIAAYREYQVAHHDRLIRCYDEVVKTIEIIKGRGHDIAIVTSKSESLALRGLAHVRLASLMDTIVGCDSSTKHKPDPEPVRIALHRLDAKPENAIFIGDSVHDVLAGNAAGVHTAAALWGAFKRADLEPGEPNAWLESISDVVTLLDGWVGS